ncbi:hypothetical protein Tco_1298068, partial [Tanacetum coccineum]
LGCRVPRKAPNVEVNLHGLLELGKSDLSLNEYLDQLGPTPTHNRGALSWYNLSAMCHSKDNVPSHGLYLCQIVLRYRCARTELITPNLICPLTYQLLRRFGGDSGPDMSFDKSASPECLLSLAYVSLAGVSKLYFSSGYFEGDYTSSGLQTNEQR